MRKVKINKGNLTLNEDILGFMEKKVTPYGTGAKVDCTKEYLHHKVYLIITKRKDKT